MGVAMQRLCYREEDMDKQNIISYCRFHSGIVSLNGREVFRKDAAQTGPDFIKALYKELGLHYPKFYKMDLYSKAALVASELVISGAPGFGTIRGEKTGIVLSNATASLHTDKKHLDTIAGNNGWFPSPAIFVYTLPNIMMGEICIRHKITGEQIFFVSEHFDPDLMEFYINSLFKDHFIEQCLGGWVDINEGRESFNIFMFIVNSGNNISFTARNLKRLFNS